MSDGGGATTPPHSPSLGVEDQTDWTGPAKYCRNQEHEMISIKTGAPDVPWVERCRLCGWIDGSALQKWADNAVKLSLTRRAQHAAIASTTEPFAFVQGGDGADLSLEDILVQAFSAVQVHTIEVQETKQGYDPKRISAIYRGTMAEIQRLIGIAVKNELAVVAPSKRICPFCGDSVSALPAEHACRGGRVVRG